MNNQNSWSETDLIPIDLYSNDKKVKANALKKSGVQKQSKTGFGTNSTFGEGKRKCKIFLKENDITLLDNKVKEDFKKYEDEKNKAIAEALNIKKDKDQQADTILKSELNFLIQGDDNTKSLETKIEDIINNLRSQISEIQNNFNKTSEDSVNLFNQNELEIINSHDEKIKPILEKFAKNNDLYYLTKNYNSSIKSIKEKTLNAPIQENIDQLVKEAKVLEINQEEVDSNDNKNNLELYKAYQVAKNISIECNDEICPSDKLMENLNKLIDNKSIYDSAKKAIENKKYQSDISSKDIIKQIVKMETLIDTALNDHIEYIKNNTTIFSKRRDKMNDVVDKLKDSIKNLTKNTEDEINKTKQNLMNKLNQERKNKDKKIESEVKKCIDQINNLLKEVANESNNINMKKDNSIKKNIKEYNDAEKQAKDKFNQSIKDYKLNLETPIDGVAYFKANLGGVFGKKSQHLKAKIIGIENNNSLLGKSKLMIVYKLDGSKKNSSTEVTNVCLYKK